MNIEVPQGSVLGTLLSLLYINDLHEAIYFCNTRHFADDTCLLIEDKSLKKIRKQLNIDLRNLYNWLKANNISHNASKTELLIFRHPNKKINYNLKIKINGERLLPSNFVKYLGTLIDSHLTWNYHTDMLAAKLTRNIGMLTKIRQYQRHTLYNIFQKILIHYDVWFTSLGSNSK